MREYGISMVSELDKYELYKMSSSVREPEAVAGKCSIKKVFSKFQKIYSKTPVLESLF